MSRLKDKYNNEVLTHQTLYGYLKQVETLIEENSDNQFYNLFSRGARIEGAEDIYLEEELSLLLPSKIDKSVSIQKLEYSEEEKEKLLMML